jgi:SAM-dependent MidA family methyltransferase
MRMANDHTTTPLEDLLCEEIGASGPISFERFMDCALYHPEFGYYRQRPHPAGRSGDYFTAVQLQPVFGLLLESALRPHTASRTLIDWGCGGMALQHGLPGWHYVPVEAGMEPAIQDDAVIVANELFDALPVRAYDLHGECLVTHRDGRFRWTAPPLREQCFRYGAVLEAMSRAMRRGWLAVFDYGYVEAEREQRFPAGSLLSYAAHRTGADVLLHPGKQDITAHVNFTHLETAAEERGFKLQLRMPMVRFLLSAGEEAFAQAAARHAPQLKLLLALAESHEALLFSKER